MHNRQRHEPRPARDEQGQDDDLSPSFQRIIATWARQDPAKAAELATRLFDEDGVDVIAIDADIQTMMAVYEVARQRPGKWVSNWHIDLSPMYPDDTLGSYNAALADVLAQVALWSCNGEWQGRRYSFGAGENAFNVTPLQNLEKDEKEQVWSTWAEVYDRGFEQ